MDYYAFYNEHILNLTLLSIGEMCARIGLAGVFGFFLGMNRKQSKDLIDLRAYMIVSITTAALAIMSQELYVDFAQSDQILSIDLSRVIAGALTGIGFLGAGAIIQVRDDKVVGTTTGATIWASGALGLTLGFGFYVIGFILFLLTFLVLLYAHPFYQTIPKQDEDDS